MKLSSQIRNLLASQSRLFAQPYGARRNAALESCQRKLESHGLYNRNGATVTAMTCNSNGTLRAGGVL